MDCGGPDGNHHSCPSDPSASAQQGHVQAISGTQAYVFLQQPGKPDSVANKATQNAKVPRKVYTFAEDPKYMHGDMFFDEKDTLHTLHNWIELSSGK